MARSPINLEALKAMVDAGATDAVIASAVRAMLSADVLLAERRRKDRERKRVKLASKRVERATSKASEPGTVEFHAEFHAENVRNSMRNSAADPPLSSFEEREISKEVSKKDAAAANARARALEISKQVWTIFGWSDFVPPAFFGMPYMIETGLGTGAWVPELIINAARKVMASGGLKRFRNYRGFGLAIADEHELARAPIPVTSTTESPNASSGRQRELKLVRPIQGGYAGRVAALARRIAEREDDGSGAV